MEEKGFYGGYLVCLGKIQFPIPPTRITTKVKGQNKTITLINGTEINVLKPAGLTEFSFEVRLPQEVYHFSMYKNGVFQGAQYFLRELEKIKTKREICQFVIYRKKFLQEGGNVNSTDLFGTNITVSLEDYTISEEASEGLDVLVSITLKQYTAYGTKKVKWKKKKKKYVLKPEIWRKGRLVQKNTHIVKKGDTLANIAKRYYKDSAEWKKIYKANRKLIEKEAKRNGRKSSSNGKYIYKGTELYLPNDSEKRGVKG